MRVDGILLRFQSAHTATETALFASGHDTEASATYSIQKSPRTNGAGRLRKIEACRGWDYGPQVWSPDAFSRTTLSGSP